MKKLYTLMLLALLTPFLLANQTVDVDVPYIITFVNNSGYDLDTGAVVSDTNFARTDKKINRNSIIYVNDFNLFTYVLFYDNLDQYIGYYTTPNSELYGSDWITAISSNEFSPPSNAYYFAYMVDKVTQNNDIPYSDLNNLSLNEVFINGQLIINSDFTTNTNTWTLSGNSSSTITNGILTLVTTTNVFDRNIYKTLSVISNNQYYLVSNITNNFNIALAIRNTLFSGTVYLINNGILNGFNSVIGTIDIANPVLYVSQQTSSITTINIDFIYLYNLTSLGLTSLTKTQLDNYFNLYQNNPNITGIGFNTFDDLTTTYRQTFYDPLPQDSIVLIVAGILGIGLMLLGFITGARIFNLFSVAPFTVIGLLLPNPGIIIAMVGLIIWQVYYAFWSKV